MLDFPSILLVFALPVVTVIVAGAYAVGANREVDVKREMSGQRGTIVALAISALIFLALLCIPLLLLGLTLIEQTDYILVLPVETLILTIGTIACGLAAFSARLRHKRAWAGAMGAVALAAGIPIGYFFVALEKTPVTLLSNTYFALLILLGTATPPVVALIYCVMSRGADLLTEDSLAPTVIPA